MFIHFLGALIRQNKMFCLQPFGWRLQNSEIVYANAKVPMKFLQKWKMCNIIRFRLQAIVLLCYYS